MTQRVLCLNNSGARDRLTLHAIYNVVGVRGEFVIVIDNRGDRTMFAAARFTPAPLGTRKEVKVRA
jgi:hypothetical protein